MKIEELEDAIAKLRISRAKVRNKVVENKSLPSMLLIFRELIKDELPPTQSKFVNTYKNRYPHLNIRGMPSRLKRAYLSYVREYHLGYLLRLHFDKVIYDEQADMAGVDYVIHYSGCKFNIHAYVNTDSGKYWRSIKNDRHIFKGRHMDLPINLGEGKRCGELILYTDGMIADLKKRMDESLESKN